MTRPEERCPGCREFGCPFNRNGVPEAHRTKTKPKRRWFRRSKTS